MPLRLTLRQITVLHAIVRGGSAAAASEALHISQPAVSKLISAMEEELGYRLFRRAGRGLEPTSEAISLMPHIERVLGEIDRLQRHAVDLQKGSAGSITIVGNHTLLYAVAAPAIHLFRLRYPDIQIDLRVLPAPQIQSSVLAQQAHIGLTYGPFFHPHLASAQIAKWPVVCVFPKHHDLAKSQEIHPKSLAGQPLLTYAEDSPIGLAIRRLFENQGFGFSASMVLSNTPSILQMVHNGLGIGLADNFAAYAENFPGLTARSIAPRIEISPILFRPPQAQATKPVDELAGLITETAETLSQAWKISG